MQDFAVAGKAAADSGVLGFCHSHQVVERAEVESTNHDERDSMAENLSLGTLSFSDVFVCALPVTWLKDCRTAQSRYDGSDALPWTMKLF